MTSNDQIYRETKTIEKRHERLRYLKQNLYPSQPVYAQIPPEGGKGLHPQPTQRQCRYSNEHRTRHWW